jgi:hypothetical protein
VASVKDRAEARLEAAVAAADLADPRPGLRAQLKRLRTHDESAFLDAVRSYEQHVLPALADGDDVLSAWLDYARSLAERLGAGRFVTLDETGRAAPFTAPYQPGSCVLHVPDDPATPALAAALPARPSPHQEAALDLLIRGRLGS